MLCWVGGQVGSPSARLPSAQVRMTLCPTATIRKILTNPAPLSTRSLHNPGEGRALQSTPTACRFGFKPVSEHIQTPYFVFNHIDSQKSSKKNPHPHLTKKMLGESATPPSDSFAWWIRWIFSTTEDLSGSDLKGWNAEKWVIWWHSRDMLRHVDVSWWDQNFPIFNMYHSFHSFYLHFTIHTISQRFFVEVEAPTLRYHRGIRPVDSKSSTTRDPPIHSRNPVNSNCDWLHLTPSNSVPFPTALHITSEAWGPHRHCRTMSALGFQQTWQGHATQRCSVACGTWRDQLVP